MMGHDLLEQIRSSKKTSVAEILQIAKDLCLGVRDLHEAGIIHRDLKPENLVKHKNGSWILIDLGSGAFHRNPTRPYCYIQSRFYRCPEITQKQKYDFGADIWSIGCILAEVLI